MTEINQTRLREALACLLADRSMTKVRLHKMLYLIERESILRNGRLAIGIRYKHHTYGMFSPQLADRLDDMVASEFLIGRPVQSDSGEGRSYRLGPQQKVEVSPEIMETCQAILQKYGDLPLARLVGVAKRTEPFLDTPKGHWINWGTYIENRCTGEHAITPEVEEALRQAEGRAKSGKLPILSREEALRALSADPG